MKIKRFTAPSMREAIRLVRDEQGPDAVILSSQRAAKGVEVVAAVDYDEALMRQAVRSTPGGTTLPASVPAAPAAVGNDPNLTKMQNEISGMRRWLESQLTTLATGPAVQHHPARNAARAELEDLGLSPEIALSL